MPRYHLFPYHTRHLGFNFTAWVSAVLAKWPVAPLAYGLQEHVILVIGEAEEEVRFGNIVFRCSQATRSGPECNNWGDDWSRSYEGKLRAIRDSYVYVHLDHYYSAHKSISCIQNNNNIITTVLHGKGYNVLDAQYCHKTIALRSDAFQAIKDNGRIVTLTDPTIDDCFHYSKLAESRRTKIAFVSTITAYKGTRTLLEVVRKLIESGNECDVDVFGTGLPDDMADFQQHVDSLVQNQSIVQVTLHGHRDKHEIAESLRRSKVLFHPSYTEGFSIAVLESLSVGCPVVIRKGVHDSRLAEIRGVVESDDENFFTDIVSVLSEGDIECDYVPTRHSAGYTLFEEEFKPISDTALPYVSEFSRFRRTKTFQRISGPVKKWFSDRVTK